MLAVTASFAWQFLIVNVNFGGNWTGLFCTGAEQPVPPALAPSTYRLPSKGYDGQFYRYVAHDPFLRQDYHRFLDGPRWRYRRILLPAAAWLLAAGQQRLIDSAYIAAVLVTIGLGVWFLTGLALDYRRHPTWGLAFLLFPSTVIALYRMTVDVALLAGCAACVWYLHRDSRGRLWLVLALAVLVHETGAFLVAGACLYVLWQRRPRRAAVLATALVPALFWYRFLDGFFQVPGHLFARRFFPSWLFDYPIVGVAMKIFLPETYPLGTAALLLVRLLDALALAGILAALGLALWRLLRPCFDPEAFGALSFGLLLCMVGNPGFWRDIHGWGRTVSPLLFFLALPALAPAPLQLRILLVVPLFLADLRLAVPVASLSLSFLGAVLWP